MEDNRNERPFRDRGHQRGGRNFHRSHRDSGSGPSHGGRGRPQRPLLTSSINGAGLSLVALVLMMRDAADPLVSERLALAVVAFGLSALISYVAQRVKPLIVELISDLFFLVGGALIVYVGLRLGGFISF